MFHFTALSTLKKHVWVQKTASVLTPNPSSSPCRTFGFAGRIGLGSPALCWAMCPFWGKAGILFINHWELLGLTLQQGKSWMYLLGVWHIGRERGCGHLLGA